MLILCSIAYNSIHKYDFICINETYLDSSVQSVDRDISMNGYNLIRPDHPTDNKRDGICIYYCESLAVSLVQINYLNECLLCEVYFNNKKDYIAVWFRSPSQNRLEFQTLFQTLKRFLVILKHLKAHEFILSQLRMALSN